MRQVSLLAVIILCLVSFLESKELPKFEPEDLVKENQVSETPAPVKVPKEKKKFINYRLFIDKVVEIKKSPNQLMVEKDLELLMNSAVGQQFVFKDTVRIKRDMVVSGEVGVWFEPREKIDVFLSFPNKYLKEFSLLDEHDYITCVAELLSYDGRLNFELKKVVSIEPFDPAAKFIEINDEIDHVMKMKKEMSYFKFKEELRRFSVKNERRLGIITGKFLGNRRLEGTNEVVLSMKYGDFPIQILCHSQYLDVLVDLKPNSRISMSVIFDSVEPREGFWFSRGCMVELRDTP